MHIDASLIGSFVRIEFVDHFRYDKITEKKLLENIKEYSQNIALGDVVEITEEFVILKNCWSAGHEYSSGIAIFRPSIKRITLLKDKEKKN